MSVPTLHYIFDPLCGWCYGAAPLIQSLRDIEGLKIQLHGGGMMSGANVQPVTGQLRNFVMHHDQRIAQLSGQPFGDDYFNRLLRDYTAVFDSTPPIAAILVAETSGHGLDLLMRIQSAHYVEGQRVSDPPVLIRLASDIGLDAKAFASALQNQLGEPVERHIQESRAWLHKAGGGGFPSFVLEIDDRLELLSHGSYFGKPNEWRAFVEQSLG
jgi:putative protein-disulfide isomerase